MTPLHFTAVTNEQDCRHCFAVMRELRPHLADAATFAAQVQRQIHDGYRLVAAGYADTAIGLIGYRIQENLMSGRFLFVDDLVVRSDYRGGAVGAQLLDFVRDEARARDCRQLVLDTGLGMARAQRFYFGRGMLTRSIGFYEDLDAGDAT